MSDNRPQQGAGGPVRLCPEMASRRLIVLKFVQDYIGEWQGSPSLGEIAAGCGISRTRARQLVARLVRDGMLVRRAGPRGLSLPGARAEAVRRLRAAGWRIDEEGCAAWPGDPALAPCTNQTLLPPPALTYDPDVETPAPGTSGEDNRLDQDGEAETAAIGEPGRMGQAASGKGAR